MRINYGDFFYNPVDKWNAVDVAVPTNMRAPYGLYHGYAVNVTEHGVIVDFLCPGRRSELVEFGRVFDCSKSVMLQSWATDATPHPSFQKNQDYNVLLRPDLNSPWKWYIGKLLDWSFHSQGYALMEIQVEQDLVRELVPAVQVRALPEGNLMRLWIKKNHFVIRSCPLPDGYPLPLSSDFWTVMKQTLEKYLQLEIRPVSAVFDTFTYMQHHDQEPLSADSLKKMFEMVKNQMSYAVSQNGILVHGHWRAVPDPAEGFVEETIDDSEEQLAALPSEVLNEIFHCLETVKQVDLRRVCKQWNELLNIAKAYEHIQVSVNNENCCNFPCSCEYDSEHCAATCVFKCLNTATEWITISDATFSQIQDSVQLLADIASQSGKECGWKRHLIVSRSHWVIGAGDMGEMMEAMVSACKKAAAAFDYMVWKNCSIEIGYPGPEFDATIGNGRVDLSAADFESQLWDFVESHLPELDVAGIARKVTAVVRNRRRKECKNLITILGTYQSVDPRPANPYRAREWTMGTLKGSLDVTKLSKITLSAFDHKVISHEETWAMVQMHHHH